MYARCNYDTSLIPIRLSALDEGEKNTRKGSWIVLAFSSF